MHQSKIAHLLRFTKFCFVTSILIFFFEVSFSFSWHRSLRRTLQQLYFCQAIQCASLCEVTALRQCYASSLSDLKIIYPIKSFLKSFLKIFNHKFENLQQIRSLVPYEKIFVAAQFILFSLYRFFAQSAKTDAIYFPPTTQQNRAKLYKQMVDTTIRLNLNDPLADSTEGEWNEAFWSIELLVYKRMIL